MAPEEDAGAERERQIERTARRLSDLLARVSELLEAPLEPGAMLARLTEIVVPGLGDAAVVDLSPEAPPKLTRTADPQAASAILGRPARSALVLPLIARGRTIGALTLARTTDERPYDEDDLAVAEDVAGRAAVALDNARLFQELRRTEGRLEAIVHNLGEAVAAFAPDGTMVFANPAAAQLAGREAIDDLLPLSLEEVLGSFIVLGEDGRELEELPLAAGLRGERPEPALLQLVQRHDGEAHWVVLRVVPVFDDARRLQLVVAVVEDVTAVKHEESRQRLLANASKLLGSSLDVEATVEKAAWAAVPELADWARVDLPDERGVLREMAVAHRELDKVALLEEWRRDFPPDPADDRGPAEVLRSGRSVAWWSVSPADVEQYARSPRHAELMRLIDSRSVLNVPMRVGDRFVGVLQLATTGETARRYTERDLELAEELARRAAIAIENARLHQARTHIASTLQRSLLPPRLPVIPRMAIAARFRAAGTAAEVGGDFYDLFGGRDGWVVVMGDVTGKGPGAAAITSLARYTLRTAVHYEDDPRAVLERLNGALAADPERRQICTAVLVLVDPDADGGPRLRVVCAGHPPPLLVGTDGAVRSVGRPGTLLGAFPQGAWTIDDVTLAAGESLVLYTDGVTDVRGNGGRFGQARLEELLRGAGGLEPDEVAALVDDALRDFGEQRDDVALLVLRAGEGEAGATAVAGAQAPTTR
ncbi:MAG: SpoIIE family protein phosphatase [Solirubrobacterales bacterium]|nr:SpoIIE family protein phosphatase [Solirubrobacterales bacterium]